MPCASRTKRAFAGRCFLENRLLRIIRIGRGRARPGRAVRAGAVCANQVYCEGCRSGGQGVCWGGSHFSGLSLNP